MQIGYSSPFALYLNGEKVHIRSPKQAITNGLGLIPEDRKGQGVSLTMTIRENISMIKLNDLSGPLRINRRREQLLVALSRVRLFRAYEALKKNIKKRKSPRIQAEISRNLSDYDRSVFLRALSDGKGGTI